MCLVLSWVPGPSAGWASLFSCGLSVWLTWAFSWHGSFKAVPAFQYLQMEDIKLLMTLPQK